MNWADLNPIRRKAKPGASSKVYVTVNPEHPHAGLAQFCEERPVGACFCVEGIGLQAAKLDLCGKVPDWDKVSPRFIAAFKTGGSVTVPLETLKGMFR